MQNNYLRFYKPQALILLILIVGLGVYFANQFISAHFVITLPVVGVVTALLFFIETFLWKYAPFKWLFWMPNIGGRYEGRIEYMNPITKIQESKKCALEIFQTGSKIKITCFFKKHIYTEKTDSKSIVESIVKNEDESYTLVFTYQNKGNQKSFPPHRGTNVLEIIENNEGKFLKGIYYTNREPQTKGKMELQFVSHVLKYDY